MSDFARDGNGGGREENVGNRDEYELMLYLERLESLREEMEELGVTSLDEVQGKIDELHRQLDAREG